MGGTLPNGTMYLPVPAADDMKFSCKKYLVPRESMEMAAGMDMGRKAHVFDAAGVDRQYWRSGGFTLEDQLQRKAKVPEEMRTDARDIHRMAPPGLKGYMGAECTLTRLKHPATMSATRVHALPPALASLLRRSLLTSASLTFRPAQIRTISSRRGALRRAAPTRTG